MTSLVIPVDPLLERDRWLQIRKRGIGASDAAAIVGLSPWESPFSVWVDKTDRLDDAPPSEAMEWGLLLEPVVRHYLTQKIGKTIVRPSGVLQHPEHSWMLASLDGIVLDDNSEEEGVAEIKTSSGWKARDWDADQGALPEHVIVQVQHQLAVTNL